MCHILQIDYSCGCSEEEEITLCHKARLKDCPLKDQTIEIKTLDEACDVHSRRYPPTETITDRPTVSPTDYSYMNVPARPLRRQPASDNLRPAREARRAPIERVEVPSSIGLSALQDRFGAMMISSNTTQGYETPGRSYPNPVPNRFESPRSSSATIPRRKPVAANVMMIPTYDNGTSQTAREAEKLLAQSRSGRGSISSSSRSPRLSSRSSRPSVSTGMSSTSQHHPHLHRDPYAHNGGVNHANPVLVPAPLDYKKTKDAVNGSPKLVPGAYPVGVEKYRDRPLPPTPPIVAQKRIRDQSMRQNSHTLLDAVPRSGVIAKAPEIPPRGSSAQQGRSESKFDEDMQNQYRANDAAVRAFHQQASQARLRNAKYAVDSGKWTMQKVCPEMECLTREERREINAYIKRRRQNEKGSGWKRTKRSMFGCAPQ